MYLCALFRALEDIIQPKKYSNLLRALLEIITCKPAFISTYSIIIPK